MVVARAETDRADGHYLIQRDMGATGLTTEIRPHYVGTTCISHFSQLYALTDQTNG